MKFNLKFGLIFLFGIIFFGSTINVSAQKGALVGKGCQEFIKDAEILYFPTKQMAIDMYNAALRQGDCAKTWDAGGEGWAIQVKPVLKGDQPSRAGQVAPVAPESYAKTITSAGVEYIVPDDLDAGDIVIRILTNKPAADAVYQSRLQSEGWARLWYDKDKRVWIVATRRAGSGGRKISVTPRNNASVNTDESGSINPTGGDWNIPRDLNINNLSFNTFPTNSAADAFYQNSMRTAGWARMWYAPAKKLWIVALRSKR